MCVERFERQYFTCTYSTLGLNETTLVHFGRGYISRKLKQLIFITVRQLKRPLKYYDNDFSIRSFILGLNLSVKVLVIDFRIESFTLEMSLSLLGSSHSFQNSFVPFRIESSTLGLSSKFQNRIVHFRMEPFTLGLSRVVHFRIESFTLGLSRSFLELSRSIQN